jgi:hypothetical protein
MQHHIISIHLTSYPWITAHIRDINIEVKLGNIQEVHTVQLEMQHCTSVAKSTMLSAKNFPRPWHEYSVIMYYIMKQSGGTYAPDGIAAFYFAVS